MDEGDSCDKDNILGDEDDDDDDDDDDVADDFASVGRRTQGGCRSDPADRASDWRRETMPTKMPTEVDLVPPPGPSRMMARVVTDRPTMSQQAGGGAASPTTTGR
jgi:hypothetical protein